MYSEDIDIKDLEKYFLASSQGQAPGFSPKNFITKCIPSYSSLISSIASSDSVSEEFSKLFDSSVSHSDDSSVISASVISEASVVCVSYTFSAIVSSADSSVSGTLSLSGIDPSVTVSAL